MWLIEALETQARRAPDETALADPRRTLTWSGLCREWRALARAIKDYAEPGDRVLLLSANRVEVLEAYLACACLGVVAAPVNPALADPELSYALDSVQPVVALADAAGKARLASLAPGVPVLDADSVPGLVGEPDEVSETELTAPFAILQTSATTGRGKGVVVDQRSLQLNAMSWLADVRPALGTRFLNAGPLFHGSMVIALDYLSAGCPVFVLEGFTPQSCLRAIESWRIEHAFLVPTMVHMLLETRQLAETDLATLQLLLHGAAPMPADLAVRARAALNVDLQTIYGITEGGGPALTLKPADQPGEAAIPGATCAGLPMTGTVARICGDDGGYLKSGEVGALRLKGDGLMRGYWMDEEATSETVIGGWLHTGDLAYQDENGFYWLVDRRTDLILRGGQNVYPAEVERVLRDHPGVADVAVVPGPSETWGQTPIAFVQPTGEGDERALLVHCVANLASYKRPSRIIFVDEIPRNPAGKILRRLLRSRAMEMV